MAPLNGGESASDTRLWHPFADMAAVRRSELTLARGEGVWVWDQAGRRYLDATASLWYANVGHGRQEIARAVAEQLTELEAYSTFGDLANQPARELADRLAALAPVPDARVFLGSGGGDGIEAAAKLARLYWEQEGQPSRRHIISRTQAYHGTHGFGTSIGGIEANRRGWGDLIPSTSQVAHDSVAALEEEIASVGAERVAAFFFEPVIGAGGVYPPVEGYLQGIARVCREHGVLLVADSVIAAFGRLGSWFGVERWSLEPDMIVFAKGVTSGYLPLGGVVVSGRVAEPFWSSPGGPWFRHGATYAGHPTCCAAALANIDILEREGLIPRGRELERPLLDALRPLAEHPAVAEVRGGTGLMAAVELDADLLAADPAAPGRLAKLVRGEGVLVRPLGAGVAVSPPLTVQLAEIELLADAVRAGLDRMPTPVATPATASDRESEAGL